MLLLHLATCVSTGFQAASPVNFASRAELKNRKLEVTASWTSVEVRHGRMVGCGPP